MVRLPLEARYERLFSMMDRQADLKPHLMSPTTIGLTLTLRSRHASQDGSFLRCLYALFCALRFAEEIWDDEIPKLGASWFCISERLPEAVLDAAECEYAFDP